jgi:hypothetical protein
MSYRFFTQLDLDLVTGIGSQQLTEQEVACQHAS